MIGDDRTRPSSPSGRQKRLLEGTLLGERYEVRQLIGEGGQGAVYLVKDHILRCSRALKLLNPEHANIERFRREAEFCAMLDSPYIIPVYDASLEKPPYYLVMPYCESEPLARYVKRCVGGLDYSEARLLLEQLAEGLAAAHAQGIVHRDLKPENLLLSRDVSGRHRLRILDFGVAHSDANTTITQEAALLGTWTYVAPEIFTGVRADHPRVDVYAVGLIMHYLLRGANVFERFRGDGPREFGARYGGGMPLVERTDLDAVVARKRLPPAFVEVVSRACAFSPAERYQDGTELLAAVRTIEQRELEDLKPGTVVARRFQIEKQIGAGGFGVVFRAKDLDWQTKVALKVVALGDLSTDDATMLRERLRREIQVLSQLNHPNVVRILSHGEIGGTPYLVLELVDGVPLSRRARSLSWSDLLVVLEQVAAALDVVNAKEVVHRDVKGQNILVGDDGKVTLIDFGVALLPHQSPLTRTGVVVGTIGNMPPEQFPALEGNEEDEDEIEPLRVSAQADQWGLAATVYELLTGFVPGGTLDGTEEQVMTEVLSGRIRPLGEVRRELPAEVCGPIDRALSLEQNARFGTCGAFVAELARTRDIEVSLHGQDTKAVALVPEPVTVPDPARKFSRRRSTMMAGVVAIAVAGIVAVYWQPWNPAQAPESAQHSAPIVVASEPAVSDAATETTAGDARAMVEVTLETHRRGKPRAGVKLEIDGEVMLSPARIEREVGTKVLVAVVDAAYEAQSKTVVVKAAGTEVLALASRRRPSAQPKATTPEEPPKDPVLIPRIYESDKPK